MTSDQHKITLPLHSAPADSWARIANRLDQEEILDGELRRLPLHNSPVEWVVIQDALRRRQFRLSITWIARAAAILIVGSGVWLFINRQSEIQTVTILNEMTTPDIVFEQSDVSAAAKELITNALNQSKGIATNAAFTELMSDLDCLEKERSELDREIERNGALPELIKARIEIENRKAQITKNLVRIVML